MHTALAMSDAWRHQARQHNSFYTAALTAPALFKPEAVAAARAATINAEKNFEFWYRSPLD